MSAASEPPTGVLDVIDSRPVEAPHVARGGSFLSLQVRPTFVKVLVLCTVFVVAGGRVVAILIQHHGLYGVTEYDDAVYLTSSLRLISGSLPYKDFVMVQPPGISVVLVPFAVLAHLIGTRDAMGVARVFTAAVAGLNAALVAWLLFYRGWFGALIGGLVLAIFPPAFAADHTVLLEPYVVVLCLIGLVLGFRNGELVGGRRLILAGLALGLACSVKTWAVLPLGAFVLMVLVSRRKDIWRALFGSVIGVVVSCGVFFAAAPSAFYRDIVTSQTSRRTVFPSPLIDRLWALTGLADSALGRIEKNNVSATHVATAVLIAIVLLGSVLPTTLRRARQFEVFAILAAVLSVGLMFYPQQFYDHYTYFPAVFLAVLFGCTASRLEWVVKTARHHFPAKAARGAIAAVVAVALVAGLVGSAVVIRQETGYAAHQVLRSGDPGPVIETEIPKGACAVSDAETLLINANRALSSDPNCPKIIDATGTWLAFDPENEPQPDGLGTKNPALVTYWANIFEHVDYVVLSNAKSFRIPWTPALRALFAKRFYEPRGFRVYKAIGQ